MIYGTVFFDPTDRCSPPSIRVANIRRITDPKELQELAELLAAMPEILGEPAVHLQRRSPDQGISEER
jgi:hypothetical protein